MQQGLFDVKKLELGFTDMSQALPHIQQAFKEMLQGAGVMRF